jgi:hypothetical protein
LTKSTQLTDNRNFMIERNTIDNTFSKIIKNKLYLWLVELSLLKENIINVDDIPSLCCNGVLFADIINRFEGVK